jgi:hypothetical protein
MIVQARPQLVNVWSRFENLVSKIGVRMSDKLHERTYMEKRCMK